MIVFYIDEIILNHAVPLKYREIQIPFSQSLQQMGPDLATQGTYEGVPSTFVENT